MPPGMEFHHIVPQEGDLDGEAEGNEDGKSPDPAIWAEVCFSSAHLSYTFSNVLLVHIVEWHS